MTNTAIPLISVIEDDAKSGNEVVIDLADVRWHVGETMYLHPVDDPAIRYNLRLIGLSKIKRFRLPRLQQMAGSTLYATGRYSRYVLNSTSFRDAE